MNKLMKYFWLVMIFPLVMITGCKEDEEGQPTVEYDILTTYLVGQGMDINNILTSAAGNKFVMAPAEAADVADRYIMDIRDSETFGDGHIEGAVNVPFTNILTQAAEAGSKQILVVCFSGQTACYATALLRLYGYSEAQALKWGMSGWNADFDVWTGNCGSSATNDANWNKDDAIANTVQDDPSLSTGEVTGDAILKARVEAAVAAGFKTASGSDVLTSPGNYFINNYFTGDHFSSFGHFSGAYRINPLTIGDGSVNTLDPSTTVATYCYTGQTSAVITAYLNVLGYNAVSITYGINGLTHDNDFWTTGAVTNHWGENASPKTFDYVQ